MKYFVDMLYYVMEHTVGMWRAAHITKHDHIDVTKATHFKIHVKNEQKHHFYDVFAGIVADIIMYLDRSLHPIGLDQWSGPNQLQSGPVSSLLQSFGLDL